MVHVASCSKVPNQSLILLLSVVPDAPNDGCVICVLLYGTQLRVVTEVQGVQGEEKRGQHHALGGFGAAGHRVRRGVLQPDTLWPASEVMLVLQFETEDLVYFAQSNVYLIFTYALQKFDIVNENNICEYTYSYYTYSDSLWRDLEQLRVFWPSHRSTGYLLC